MPPHRWDAPIRHGIAVRLPVLQTSCGQFVFCVVSAGAYRATHCPAMRHWCTVRLVTPSRGAGRGSPGVLPCVGRRGGIVAVPHDAKRPGGMPGVSHRPGPATALWRLALPYSADGGRCCRTAADIRLMARLI